MPKIALVFAVLLPALSMAQSVKLLEENFEAGIGNWLQGEVSVEPTWDTSPGNPGASLRLDGDGIKSGLVASSECFNTADYDIYVLRADVFEISGIDSYCGIITLPNEGENCSGPDLIFGDVEAPQNAQGEWIQQRSGMSNLASFGPSFRVVLFGSFGFTQCSFDNVELFGINDGPIVAESVPTLSRLALTTLGLLVVGIGLFRLTASRSP